jgi:amino acid permease
MHQLDSLLQQQCVLGLLLLLVFCFLADFCALVLLYCVSSSKSTGIALVVATLIVSHIAIAIGNCNAARNLECE